MSEPLTKAEKKKKEGKNDFETSTAPTSDSWSPNSPMDELASAQLNNHFKPIHLAHARRHYQPEQRHPQTCGIKSVDTTHYLFYDNDFSNITKIIE